MLALTTFWQVFWIVVLVVPLICLWVYAFVDIFRRDELSGVAKVVWVLVVFLLPYFGTLIYFFTKPMSRAIRS